METLFDSAALPAAQRSEAWLETTSKALLTTQVEISDSATFQARLRAMNVGAAQMSSMSYGPLLSRRTPRLIRQSDPEQYQIALVRSGHQSIDQTDSHACLGRGNWSSTTVRGPSPLGWEGARAVVAGGPIRC